MISLFELKQILEAPGVTVIVKEIHGATVS
jgi:hypothetical protein